MCGLNSWGWLKLSGLVSGLDYCKKKKKRGICNYGQTASSNFRVNVKERKNYNLEKHTEPE